MEPRELKDCLDNGVMKTECATKISGRWYKSVVPIRSYAPSSTFLSDTLTTIVTPEETRFFHIDKPNNISFEILCGETRIL